MAVKSEVIRKALKADLVERTNATFRQIAEKKFGLSCWTPPVGPREKFTLAFRNGPELAANVRVDTDEMEKGIFLTGRSPMVDRFDRLVALNRGTRKKIVSDRIERALVNIISQYWTKLFVESTRLKPKYDDKEKFLVDLNMGRVLATLSSDSRSRFAFMVNCQGMTIVEPHTLFTRQPKILVHFTHAATVYAEQLVKETAEGWGLQIERGSILGLTTRPEPRGGI